jgi:hypothetical protein
MSSSYTEPSVIKSSDISITITPITNPAKPSISDEVIINLFKELTQCNISVVGLPCLQMPSGSNMFEILNISNLFKKYGYIDEYYETYFLSGLAAINGRKYNQAVDFFRKYSKEYIKRLIGVEDEAQLSFNKDNWVFGVPHFEGIEIAEDAEYENLGTMQNANRYDSIENN